MTTCTTTERRGLATLLVENHFSASDNELYLGGVPTSELLSHYGSPVFVYDGGVIGQRLETVRKALTNEIDIYYSIKANPNQSVLKFFVSRRCGLETASLGEIWQALHAGARPERLIFAGPGKSDHELRQALRWRIGEIHVESLGEAERLERIALELDVFAPVALRVNPTPDVQGGAMRMGGRGTPFGIDELQLPGILERLRGFSHLQIRGIHLYCGTQVLDHALLLRQFRKAVQIGRRVASQLGRPLRTLDFGGGWGIPYFARDQRLDLVELAAGMNRMIHEIQSEWSFSDTHFIVEPGRFLVGEAGVYVTRVVDIKVSHGKTFIVVDGGMHQHLAASGNLGQTLKRNFPVAIGNRLFVAADGRFDVVGPLCTPLDVLARDVELPCPQVGDPFCVFQSGAYARAASPLQFLSHPAPCEAWVDSGKHWLIRRRGRPEDYLVDQVFQEAKP